MKTSDILSAFAEQADLLLPRERTDGREARPVQSALLDLEQLVGGAEQGETHSCSSCDVHHYTLPPCSSFRLISVKHTNPVTVGVIVEKRGSSADCWVYQSVMNINEEPPRQQTCIIHQPARLFVQTPAEIFFVFISIPTFFNHKERKMESTNIS